jgi:hypothetical protein
MLNMLSSDMRKMDREPVPIRRCERGRRRRIIDVLSVCFIKEIKWGRGVRYYVTHEPNVDLEPYFMLVYDYNYYVVDAKERVYLATSECATNKCRKPTILQDKHPGDKDRMMVIIPHIEAYRYWRCSTISPPEFKRIQQAIRKFCKNG